MHRQNSKHKYTCTRINSGKHSLKTIEYCYKIKAGIKTINMSVKDFGTSVKLTVKLPY